MWALSDRVITLVEYTWRRESVEEGVTGLGVSIMEELDVDGVGEWLIEKGFSSQIAKAFADEEMDGEAIMQAFATCPGPDCLKEVISKPFGTRVKVYTAIRNVLAKDNQGRDNVEVDSQGDSGQSKSPVSTDLTRIFSSSDEQPAASSTQSTPNQSVCSLGSTRQRARTNQVPNPFPISAFRTSTEENLEKKRLGEDDRKYIVRVLSTILCTYVPNPSMRDCGVVAESLLRKYSFLKESNSWRQYIYVRCQNVNRKCSHSMPQPKQLKLDTPKRVYAVVDVDIEDDVSAERNKELLKKEMAKSKPKQDILRELIKRTYKTRRELINNGMRPEEVILEYPHLKRIKGIYYEFDLMVDQDDSFGKFRESWDMWKKPIMDYASSSSNKPARLQHALRDFDSNDEAEADALTVMRCLGYFFIPKSRKKRPDQDCNDIPHLLMEGKRGTPPSELADRETNQPHLVRLVDEELSAQYFVVVEQIIHLEVSGILQGVFVVLAFHYFYDMEYHPRLKDLYFFLENKLLKINSATHLSITYSSITSTLESYLSTAN